MSTTYHPPVPQRLPCVATGLSSVSTNPVPPPMNTRLTGKNLNSTAVVCAQANLLPEVFCTS